MEWVCFVNGRARKGDYLVELKQEEAVLRNNCGLVLVSAMSEYVTGLSRACNKESRLVSHRDFPSNRVTGVVLYHLFHLLSFLAVLSPKTLVQE
jgi:hypothetical protein